ncbi:MAG: RES domain-containing protein [Bacteroidota bacterium]
MEVKEVYPAVVEQWKHDGFEKFMGHNSSYMNFELGLSNADIFDRCFYFMVRVRRVYENQIHGQVFLGVTSTTFRIGYNFGESPSVAFLFNLVEKATYDFAEIFHYRKQQTTLFHHKIERPVLQEIEDTIQGIINIWDQPTKAFKAEIGERITNFKQLPAIPEPKLYNVDDGITLEQKISHKLLTGKYVSAEERQVFKDLTFFYRELEVQLALLDYSSFTPQDIKDFKNYTSYAFNYTALLTNELTIYKAYRLVVNESVSGSNESITESRYLTYPDLELVKKFGRYNRGNTCNTTVLYTAESIDTALKEIRPMEGKRVTVGVWRPKSKQTFTCYPIVHNEDAVAANDDIAMASRSIKILEQLYDPLFVEFMNYYLKLLSNEYSKPIKHHLEYIISAIFSERIFLSDNGHPDFAFDCILYPSVGNDLKTRNIVFKPSVIDDSFILDKAIEFIVSESFYDQPSAHNANPEHISLANVTHYRETSEISNEGKIRWANYIQIQKIKKSGQSAG